MKIRLWALAVLAAAALAARAEEASPVLQTALREQGTGATVSLEGLDPLTLPAVPVTRAYSGGLFVYSGCPEYCPGPGVLYRDTFAAGSDVRLYLYHVNASNVPLHFSIVLEPVDGPATVTLENAIVTGPDLDYGGIGRLSSFVQLGRPLTREPRVIKVDHPVLLDPDLDGKVVYPHSPEILIHSIHDIRVAGGAVKVSVVAVDAGDDTLARFPSLTLLHRDIHHDRGTYEGSTEDVTMDAPYSTASGPAHIRMVDGKADPFPQGGDKTMGMVGEYRGGYGVIYRLHLKMESPDGRKVALLLNPRAGMVAGAVAVEVPRHGRSTAHVPYLSADSLGDKDYGAILGKWDPAVTPEVTVLWTPPAAASLPVEMVLVPYSPIE